MPDGTDVFGIVVRDVQIGATMIVQNNQIDAASSTGTGTSSCNFDWTLRFVTMSGEPSGSQILRYASAARFGRLMRIIPTMSRRNGQGVSITRPSIRNSFR